MGGVGDASFLNLEVRSPRRTLPPNAYLPLCRPGLRRAPQRTDITRRTKSTCRCRFCLAKALLTWLRTV